MRISISQNSTIQRSITKTQGLYKNGQLKGTGDFEFQGVCKTKQH